MELRHLRYFLAVAEEKSFTLASYRLEVDQSVVSRQVRALEKDLRTDLFARDTARVRLTPAGQELYRHATKILQSVSEARLAVCKHLEETSHLLRLAYMPQFLSSFLSPAIEVFSQVHPELNIEFVELSPGKQVEALREERVDIAFAGMVCDRLLKEFDVFTIVEVPLSALFAKKHPLAKKKRLSWNDLEKEKIIGLSERAFPGRMELLRSCFSTPPQFVHRADSINSLLAYAGTGSGVAIIPQDVERFLPAHLTLRPITPARKVTIQALVKGGEKRPALRAFLQECRNRALNLNI